MPIMKKIPNWSTYGHEHTIGGEMTQRNNIFVLIT